MHLFSIANDEKRLIRRLLPDMLDGNEENGQQDRFKIMPVLEIIANLAYVENYDGIYLIDSIDIIIQTLTHIWDIFI
ncbi:unnamed protein product [Rotaria sp. Silwood1]|nr:unnamed protein product [Rotaria sp. Silwood1]CAF5002470.1 unnamed protein product [Rotaria sp. Silwood1]